MTCEAPKANAADFKIFAPVREVLAWPSIRTNDRHYLQTMEVTVVVSLEHYLPIIPSGLKANAE